MQFMGKWKAAYFAPTSIVKTKYSMSIRSTCFDFSTMTNFSSAPFVTCTIASACFTSQSKSPAATTTACMHIASGIVQSEVKIKLMRKSLLFPSSQFLVKRNIIVKVKRLLVNIEEIFCTALLVLLTLAMADTPKNLNYITHYLLFQRKLSIKLRQNGRKWIIFSPSEFY